MNAACHVLYPAASLITAPDLQPADQLCARAPDAVAAVGGFVAVCVLLMAGMVVAIVRNWSAGR